MLSSNTNIDAGQSALLVCVGYGEPGLAISWYFGGAPLMTTSLATIYELDYIKGGKVYKQSILELCSPTMLANGDYTCVVDNTQISINASTNLTVTG